MLIPPQTPLPTPTLDASGVRPLLLIPASLSSTLPLGAPITIPTLPCGEVAPLYLAESSKGGFVKSPHKLLPFEKEGIYYPTKLDRDAKYSHVYFVQTHVTDDGVQGYWVGLACGKERGDGLQYHPLMKKLVPTKAPRIQIYDNKYGGITRRVVIPKGAAGGLQSVEFKRTESTNAEAMEHIRTRLSRLFETGRGAKTVTPGAIALDVELSRGGMEDPALRGEVCMAAVVMVRNIFEHNSAAQLMRGDRDHITPEEVMRRGLEATILSRATVAVAYNKWVTYIPEPAREPKEKGNTNSNRAAYYVGEFVKQVGPEKRVCDLTPEDGQAFVNSKDENGKFKYSNSTRNKMRQYLQSFGYFLPTLQTGLTINVFEFLHRISRKPRKVRIIPFWAVRRALDILWETNRPLCRYFAILLFTGVRPEQLSVMSYQAFDKENRVMLLSKDDAKGESTKNPLMVDNRVWVCPALYAYIEDVMGLDLPCLPPSIDLANPKQKISRNTVRSKISEVLKRVWEDYFLSKQEETSESKEPDAAATQAPKEPWHFNKENERKTFASHARSAGMDIDYIVKIVGHKNGSVVLDAHYLTGVDFFEGLKFFMGTFPPGTKVPVLDKVSDYICHPGFRHAIDPLYKDEHDKRKPAEVLSDIKKELQKLPKYGELNLKPKA
jgi:integrase